MFTAYSSILLGGRSPDCALHHPVGSNALLPLNSLLFLRTGSKFASAPITTTYIGSYAQQASLPALLGTNGPIPWLLHLPSITNNAHAVAQAFRFYGDVSLLGCSQKNGTFLARLVSTDCLKYCYYNA